MLLHTCPYAAGTHRKTRYLDRVVQSGGMCCGSAIRAMALAGEMPEAVDGSGEDDCCADEHALKVGADAGDVAAGPEESEHQYSQHVSKNSPLAAEQAGPADHHRGDDGQLRAFELIGHGAAEIRSGHDACNSRGQSGN